MHCEGHEAEPHNCEPESLGAQASADLATTITDSLSDAQMLSDGT